MKSSTLITSRLTLILALLLNLTLNLTLALALPTTSSNAASSFTPPIINQALHSGLFGTSPTGFLTVLILKAYEKVAFFNPKSSNFISSNASPLSSFVNDGVRVRSSVEGIISSTTVGELEKWIMKLACISQHGVHEFGAGRDSRFVLPIFAHHPFNTQDVDQQHRLQADTTVSNLSKPAIDTDDEKSKKQDSTNGIQHHKTKTKTKKPKKLE